MFYFDMQVPLELVSGRAWGGMGSSTRHLHVPPSLLAADRTMRRVKSLGGVRESSTSGKTSLSDIEQAATLASEAVHSAAENPGGEPATYASVRYGNHLEQPVHRSTTHTEHEAMAALGELDNSLPPGGLDCFIDFVYADFVKEIVRITKKLKYGPSMRGFKTDEAFQGELRELLGAERYEQYAKDHATLQVIANKKDKNHCWIVESVPQQGIVIVFPGSANAENFLNAMNLRTVPWECYDAWKQRTEAERTLSAVFGSDSSQQVAPEATNQCTEEQSLDRVPTTDATGSESMRRAAHEARVQHSSSIPRNGRASWPADRRKVRMRRKRWRKNMSNNVRLCVDRLCELCSPRSC